jgi:hypothetical protein
MTRDQATAKVTVAGGRQRRLRHREARLFGDRRRGLAALRRRPQGLEAGRRGEAGRQGRGDPDHLGDRVLTDARGRRARVLRRQGRRRLRAPVGDGHRSWPRRRAARQLRAKVHPPASPGTSASPSRIAPSILAPRSQKNSSRGDECAPSSPTRASPCASSPSTSASGSSPAGRRRSSSWSRSPKIQTPELRSFISAALLADDSPATKRMRVDPSRPQRRRGVRLLRVAAPPSPRGLGMELIRQAHPRPRDPRGAVPPQREPGSPGHRLRRPAPSGASTATAASPPAGGRQRTRRAAASA